MKRIILLISFCSILFSCQKAPFLTLNTPATISFPDQGGTQSISFSTNREWTAKSSESWCKVSPASGTATEETNSISISCEPNTTYDARTCSITLKVEELTETITVTQEQLDGLFVSPKEFNLTSEEQTIQVKVHYNVSSDLVIPDDAKEWVSLKRSTSTRGLAETSAIFTIAKNTTHDNRETSITFKQINGQLAETVIVRQKQSD